MAPISPAQNATTQIDISTMKPGLAPGDFTFCTGSGDVGDWRVVEDPTASNRQAIAQTSKDPTDYRFPLAIYKPISVKNVNVVVRFKPVGGKVDQAGGIVVVRLTTPDDYYVVRANALEDNVRFYRAIKGQREQIKGANTKVASNHWHTLGLRGEDDRFAIAFDRQELFTTRDNTFTGPGKVGLWTKADSVTHFDMIAITRLG